MQKFHPILFSTPMVQAILEGRKTMTRRLRGLEKINNYPGQWAYLFWKPTKEHLFYNQKNAGNKLSIKCPYGKVGDVLWVRETWNELMSSYYYKATDSEWCNKWKPSIFMPKAACRIFLEITEIKVERLQDITEDDAIKEGAHSFDEDLTNEQRLHNYNHPSGRFYGPKKLGFKRLWQSINGPNSWEANPFVWVISFKRIEKPLNFK